MLDFLKRFMTVIVSLAGIAGLYLGALAVNLVGVFWWIIAISALAAAVPLTLKHGLEIANRHRNYPKLLKQLAESQVQVDELKKSAKLAEEASVNLWKKGLTEGQSQILGALWAVDTPYPKLIAIQEDTNGVTLVAEYQEGGKPRIGARFSLINHLGGKRGSVQVFQVDESQNLTFLKRVDDTSPTFWSHLQELAKVSSSIPGDVELSKYQIVHSFNELPGPPQLEIDPHGKDDVK